MASQGTTSVRETIVSLPQLRSAPADVPAPPSRWRPLLLALASGALLSLCYFPVGWNWLAWVALLPFLALVRSSARPRTLYFAAWLGGVLFFGVLLRWMRVADPRMYATWAALALYCPVYFAAALFLLRRLDRGLGLPLTVSLPVVWTAVELFRSCFPGLFASILLGSHQHDYPGGFSWYLLGYSQHDVLEVIQIADIGGVYAVTFLVALVNGLLFEVLYARSWFRALIGPDAPAPRSGRLGLLGQGLAVLLLLLATLAYGTMRLGEDAGSPGPSIALIQGNVEQRVRNESSGGDADASKKIFKEYMDLTDLAKQYRPDLIVWPETSYPDPWLEMAPGLPNPRCLRDIAEPLTERWQTSLLLGMNAVVADGEHGRLYNSAVLLGPTGQFLGRYDKVHRVPFGEYVPMRDLLPWLNSLAPYEFDYSVRAGDSFTRFPLRGRDDLTFTFGVVICYEDTVPEMSRPYVMGGERTNFLINISNEGWFDGTSEHDENLAICRFRAVECRRSVARTVNMGISAVIDGNGRVLRPERVENSSCFPVWRVSMSEALPVSEWENYKKVSGVLLATVPIDGRTSLYARWGNWLPWSCWGLIVVGLTTAFVRRRGGP